MRYNSPSEQPEFIKATRDEWLARTLSFHPLNESVCGFVLVPMTLSHYSLLRIAGSAFLLKDETPSEDDVIQFLWCLSPEYNRKRPGWLFRLRCRRLRGERNLARLAVAVKKIRDFMQTAMLDRPAAVVGSGIDEPDYYCDEAAIVASMARDKGWSEEAILNLPLRRLFQYMKEMRHHYSVKNGQPHMLCNRSEEIADEYLRKVNSGEI